MSEEDDRPNEPASPKREAGLRSTGLRTGDLKKKEPDPKEDDDQAKAKKKLKAKKPKKPPKPKKPKKPKKPVEPKRLTFVTFGCPPAGSPPKFTLTAGVFGRFFHSFGVKLESMSGSEVISLRGVDGGGGVLFAGSINVPAYAGDVFASIGPGGGGSTNEASVNPLPNLCFLPNNGKVIVETSGTSGGTFSNAVFTYEDIIL